MEDSDLWLRIVAVALGGILVAGTVQLGRYLTAQIQVWRHATRNQTQVLTLLPEQIKELTKKVLILEAENHPNGGYSMRDSLNRIEIRQIVIEQTQRALISDMQVGVFTTNHEGHCEWVNRKMLQMTGRSMAELKGFGWLNAVAKEERTAIRGEWGAALKDEREVELTFHIVFAGHKPLLVNLRNSRMYDEHHNHVLGYINIVQPYEDLSDGS